jgi:NAD(P)-dependent dehydrogenase (short-subunit alcohol dehydrogenase family)
MKISTNQRVALITGANRGIGLQTAKDLGPDGVFLLLGVRNLAEGQAVAESIRNDGFQVEPVRLNVTDPSMYEEVYDFIDRVFGRLDILVNNAGICLENPNGSGSDPSTLSSEILRETFETNFFGTVALTQKLLPLIRRAQAGRIVNVSSIMGSLTLHSDPSSPIYHSRVFAYNTSKSALNSFTVHLAYELRHTSIKVNSCHPGWVKTEMGGENAELEVSEGGRTSAWLASLPGHGPTGGYFHAGQSLPW